MNKEKRKLSSLCKIVIGRTPSTKNKKYWDDVDGNNWLTIQDITRKKVITKKRISDEAIKRYDMSKSPKNSLLFCFIGTISISTSYDGYYFNQAIANLIPNPKLVNRHYLKYYLDLHIDNYKQMYKNSIMPYINKNNINNLEILLPSLEEQNIILNRIKSLSLNKNKICNFLRVIRNYREKLLEYYFHNLVGKKEILQNIITTYCGQIINRRDLKQEGKYPVYTASVYNDGLKGYMDKYNYDGEYGTYTGRGYAGNLFYRNGKFNLSSNSFAWNICNKNIALFKYVFFYLKWKEDDVKKVVINGSVIKMFSQKMLANYSIILPSIAKQKALIAKIDAIYWKINCLENKILKLMDKYKIMENKINRYLFYSS